MTPLQAVSPSRVKGPKDLLLGEVHEGDPYCF